MQNNLAATPSTTRTTRWRYSTAVQAARVLNRVAGASQPQPGPPLDRTPLPVPDDRSRSA